MLPIFVVNNHGQFNHLILRTLRDLEIQVELIPNTEEPEKVAEASRGVILGGGPDIYKAGRSAEYLVLDIPVLGICLGLHIITKTFGGEVVPGQKGGYGAVDVNILDSSGILEGYPDNMTVWASHTDEVAKIPEDFNQIATSSICYNEAIAHKNRPLYGIQWHPEVSHSFEGSRLFENFDRICME